MYIKDLDDKYVAGTYSRFPLELVSGKGSVLKDVNGKEYIDLGSGIGVTAFGINDDTWTDAVKDQLDKVQHTSNLYYTEPCARLAEALCEKTGMKKVFFGNSGAEANECAIKVARKWAAENKGEEYNVIVTLVNSFHGRTLTTLAATGQEVFHKYFQPLTPGFAYVEAGNVEMLKKVCEEEKVAGILFECIQGEGGVVPLTAEFIQTIADICEEKNIIMMVDEVQTGNGRTGALYSYMNFGLKPDVVSTAKGLGGGLPIGACLMSEKVQNVLGPSDHGSTFGGNPVASAGALSIVNRLDDALMAEVKEKSAYVFAEMEGAKGIESVTGLGLMIGIKTEKPVSEVLSKCMEKGVICLSAKDKVRLLPALNIPMDVLKKAVAVIKEVCAE
ncbi:MAG: acetylornithine/succinylornithine family transaminase [Lachnospiraceae bacterium]|nr:acetylornithine/succinylornithine family transaminase [Lachnospiraceae bacterium]